MIRHIINNLYIKDDRICFFRSYKVFLFEKRFKDFYRDSEYYLKATVEVLKLNKVLIIESNNE